MHLRLLQKFRSLLSSRIPVISYGVTDVNIVSQSIIEGLAKKVKIYIQNMRERKESEIKPRKGYLFFLSIHSIPKPCKPDVTI